MLHCIHWFSANIICSFNLEMIMPLPYVVLCCSASMQRRKTSKLCFRMQVPLLVWGVLFVFGFLVCLFFGFFLLFEGTGLEA